MLFIDKNQKINDNNNKNHIKFIWNNLFQSIDRKTITSLPPLALVLHLLEAILEQVLDNIDVVQVHALFLGHDISDQSQSVILIRVLSFHLGEVCAEEYVEDLS